MLQSTILRNSPKFKAAILQTSLIKESINMLSIIIFPNPPADLWNDPNNEHTQQHTPEKIKVENSAELGEEKSVCFGRDEKGERSRFKSFVIGSVRLGIIDFSPEFQEAP